MSPIPKIVTIFGGSGFLGRYIARRMAKEGWRVRVAVRRPNEAIFVRPYGVPGQVEPVLANIRDEDSVRSALRGADAVVNCVGILNEVGKQKFDAVHREGAERVARLAAEENVGRMVHISSLAADPDAESDYARSKAEGDALAQEAFPSAVILQPSLLFGPEDEFFNRFGKLSRFTPVIPLVGPETKFQPVYVDDVAQAAIKGVLGQADAGIYQLGGPQVETFEQLIKRTMACVRRRRLLFPLPFFIARIDAWGLDLMQTLTLGLFTNTILTKDQVKQLQHDVVVADGAKGLDDLGIEATPMDTILDSYLYCHRPQGQFTELTESARNI